MTFSSPQFAVFFLALLGALSVIRSAQGRKWVLLVACYFFYGYWDWRFLPLLLAFTLVTYLLGQRIAAAEEPERRRAWLTVSVVVSLGTLGFFKYTNFLLGSLAPLFRQMGIAAPHYNILLPIGVSFFTFQAISYCIDIYRREIAPARSLFEFALFKAFFPQLVAGPIVRAAELLPQIQTAENRPMVANLNRGACIFLVGLVEKTLIADRVALLVDPIFAHPTAFDSATVWAAVIGYAVQIYCDFSGYTDMAIGLAKALGYDLPINFRLPYLAGNVTEFWRRWHISLSTWLRDYLYISLGGNRRGTQRTYLNLILTMLLGGLWHGASWNFVVWGGLHGTALALHKLMGVTPARRRLSRVLSTLGTFLFVCVCWVFFRANTFSTAWAILQKMALIDAKGVRWIYEPFWAAVAALGAWHVLRFRDSGYAEIPLFTFRGWAVISAVAYLLWFAAPIASSPFIYFQF